MPKYLGKVSFTPEGLKGLRKVGAVNRVKQGEAIAAGIGGTLESYHFAFGDHDVYAIFDLPDDEAASALSIAVNEAGAATATITKLLTAEQVDEALGRTVDYTPPGQ